MRNGDNHPHTMLQSTIQNQEPADDRKQNWASGPVKSSYEKDVAFGCPHSKEEKEQVMAGDVTGVTTA